MRAAIWAEVAKLAASTVGRVGTAAIVLGVSLIGAGMLAAAAFSSDPQIIAKLGPAATADWSGLLLGAAQITGAGGLLGFAVVLAWMFGREFADGAVVGVFALPVRRSSIALAKLVAYLGWSVLVSVALAGALLLVGSVAGFGALDQNAWTALGRQVALGVLSAMVTLPVAWVATLVRSVLGGVSAAIGLVVIAQVSVLAGVGGWLPAGAPALWAVSSGAQVTGVQLALVVPFAMLFAGLVAVAWSRLQLDR